MAKSEIQTSGRRNRNWKENLITMNGRKKEIDRCSLWKRIPRWNNKAIEIIIEHN